MEAQGRGCVLSIDVGTTNLALWLGSCTVAGVADAPENPLDLIGAFETRDWRLVNLRSSTPAEATNAFVRYIWENRADLLPADLDAVLIESQEAATPLMQRLSNAMQAAFVALKCSGAMGTDWQPNILFIHGRGKLQVLKAFMGEEGYGDLDPPPRALKAAHSINKWMAERDVRYVIAHCPNAEHWLGYYLGHSKRNDLADAMLQAIYYFLRSRFPAYLSHPKRKHASS